MEVGENGYHESPFSRRGLSLAEANFIEEVDAWLNSENSAVHQWFLFYIAEESQQASAFKPAQC